MLLEVCANIWERNDRLFVSVAPPEYFPGSLMSAWLELQEARYRTVIYDLSGTLAVRIPQPAIDRFSLRPGMQLCGRIRVRDFSRNHFSRDIESRFKEIGVDIARLPTTEVRQALLFVDEAESPEIRRMRIDALVSAWARR